MPRTLLLALLLACSGPSVQAGAAGPEAPAPSPAAACAIGGTMALPDFPDDALFQYLRGNREGEYSGFRVLLDGRLLRMKRDGPWQEDAPLGDQRLQAMQAALAAAEIEAHAGIYQPQVAPDDATSWAMAYRNAQGEVSTLGGVGCKPELVQPLFDQIAPLLVPPAP